MRRPNSGKPSAFHRADRSQHIVTRRRSDFVKRLIDESDIREQVTALGRQITEDYAGKPLTVLPAQSTEVLEVD